MAIRYYGYPKCSTCRKAVKWLEESGMELEKFNIAETPPSVEELTAMITTSKLDIKKFFNTSGKVYREEKMKDKLPTMTEEEKIELLASNGMLIKRPIVYGDGKATVGFKEETFNEVWGSH